MLLVPRVQVGQFAFEPQRGDSATIGPDQKCIRGHHGDRKVHSVVLCGAQSYVFAAPLALVSCARLPPPAQTGGCPRVGTLGWGARAWGAPAEEGSEWVWAGLWARAVEIPLGGGCPEGLGYYVPT